MTVIGEMDYKHFRQLLIKNKGRPAIVNVNIGSTVKGAVDDVDKVLLALSEAGYTEDLFYIHCDGALLGIMVCCVQPVACMTLHHRF